MKETETDHTAVANTELTGTPSEMGPSVEVANSTSDSEAADPTPQVLDALNDYYNRLSLSDADRKILVTQRGLSHSTIELLGYRSNLESNKEILLEMANRFPVAVLVESGLWKTDSDKIAEPPKPNPQFYGMSIVEKRDAKGKKVRGADGEVVRECVWNHPILIPYFNEAMKLVHLRPHKGMMRGKPPRFYVVRPKGQASSAGRQASNHKFAIVTEGEFKAAALWQVLGDVAEIAALPGITMAKPLIGEVEEWLELTGVRQVVVGYDNEDKGNETLPDYQPEQHRRHDTQVWARYLARQLSRQGYEGKVCVLPDQWRDAKGKADWDGCLAAFIKELGAADGSLAAWDQVRGQIRDKFLSVIQGARYIGESHHANFFDPEVERIIRSALNRISYEPCLPVGGEDEQVYRGRDKGLTLPLPPNRTGGSPASGFPVSVFPSGIEAIAFGRPSG